MIDTFYLLMTGRWLGSLQLRTSLTTPVLPGGRRGSQFLWDPRRRGPFKKPWIPVTRNLTVALSWIFLSTPCHLQLFSQFGPYSHWICLTADRGALVHENYLHPIMSSQIFKEVPNTVHVYLRPSSAALCISPSTASLASLSTHLPHASAKTWDIPAPTHPTSIHQFLLPCLCWIGCLRLTCSFLSPHISHFYKFPPKSSTR